MSDIVETIQVEQDWIIRSPHKGVLVVQGGPGTGKTAVALHRAAFLLYTYREQLARRAVLIIGPNPTFLRYVGQVLPSLGETSVLLSTIADLYPGITARRDEPAAAAAVKGRLDMAKVMAAAVRARQGGSPSGLEVSYDHDVLRLDRRACTRIRDRARRTRQPHNQARPVAHRLLIDALAGQVADKIGYDVLGGGNLLSEEDIDDIRQELRESVQVRAALEEFWPRLTPEGLLAELLSSPEQLAVGGARAAHAGGTLGPAAARRRRVDPGGRAAAGRGGGTARRGPPGRPRAQRAGAAPADRLRTRGARPGLQLPVRRPEPRRRGGDPVRLRHHRRRTPRRPLRGRRRTAPLWNGPPPTAPGRSATSWSTRRRSFRRWRGGCSCAAARPAR